MTPSLEELHQAGRTLRRQPGFAALAVLVLTLGIAANAAVFSIVDSLLLAPIPGAERGVLVGLYSKHRTKTDAYRGFSYPNYVDIRERTASYLELMAQGFGLVGLTEGDQTRRALVMTVSSNFFDVFGVTMARGRAFAPEEERPGSLRQVAIASYGYWANTGFAPDIVGRTVTINTKPYEIVGVAPRGFSGSMAIASPELWLPLGVYPQIVNEFQLEDSGGDLTSRANHALLVSGRLSREVSREEAAVRLDSVTAQLAEIDSAVNADQSLMVHPLPRLGLSTSPTDDGGLSAVATLLMVMSGLVLLVACSNLANMMLARGTARRRELAVRLALGSSRGRIVRQMLLEGAWLSAAGTGLGLLAGAGLVSLLARSLASASLGVQLTLESWPTATVVALTLTVAAIGTAFFALAPAWSLTRGDASLLHEAKEPAGGLTGRRTTVRRALVVAQLVMSVVLLVLGGLFVRGAVNVTRGDPGFRLEGGLMATLDPTFAGISEGRARDFYVRTLERLRSHPSFERAAIAATVPFGDINEGERVSRPGAAPEGEGRRGISANFNIVSAQYFSALGLPVLLGRDFTPQEETSNAGTPVAILSAPLARRLFGDESPVGQQIRIEPREGQPATPLRTVVGVVPGVRQDVLSAEPDAFVYLPWGQAYRAGMTVHARQRDGRAEAAPGAAEELRRTLREVDASVPVLTLRTLTAHRDANLIVWMMRTLAGLLLGFAGVALLLAAVGTYAVHAFLVARATREIGVRMALGARPADVYRLVLGEAGRLVGLALLLGIGLSLPAGFAAGSVLYLVAPFDPVILVAVCTTLALAGALAAYVPARRAARINPVLALRAE